MNFKRSAVLLFAAILLPYLAQAQKAYKFEVKYEPNTTYKTILSNVGEVVMDLDANDEMKAQMEAAGQSFPMTMISSQSVASSLKTKSKTEDNSLPVVITYDDISGKQSMNGQSMPMPQDNPMLGAKIIANISEKGKIKVEDIEGQNINDQMKQLVSTTLDKMFDMVKFPEDKMKLGESFEINIPLSLPIMGKSLDMDIKTTYTLKNVKNDIASFDIIQLVEMTADMEGMTISATGNGTGTFRFDMKKSFYQDFQTKLLMKMNMVVPNPGNTMRMNMNMDMDSSVEYQIVN